MKIQDKTLGDHIVLNGHLCVIMEKKCIGYSKCYIIGKELGCATHTHATVFHQDEEEETLKQVN